MRDEFDDGPLYRMNTVFKLGYQAWLLLGLAAIGALALRARVAGAAAAALDAGPARGAARGRRDRLPRRRHVRAQGRLHARADARRPRLAARPRARATSARSRSLNDTRGRGRGRARGGRRRLLGLRPRPHLDVHRAADGARLARARAPVGPRRRDAARGRRAHVRVADDGRRAAAAGPLRRPLGRRRPARADRVRRRGRGASGTSSGERVYDRDGTTVWRLDR